jgi:hypothetical protein
MKKLLVIALVAFAAALGSTALGAGNSASADDQDRDRDRERVRIACHQEIAPSAPDWEGLVMCTIDIDQPDPVPDVSGMLRIRYRDRNQNGLPDFADQKMCWDIDVGGEHKGNCPAQ